MKPAAALIAILLAAPAQGQTVAEPDGYRGEPYRAPVPATLAGAQVIDTARAMDLHGQGVPFLDVLPRKKRPENLPPGTLWVEEVHRTIPGAVWLYDTGYQELAPAETARLTEGLAAGQTIQSVRGSRFPATDWDGRPEQQVCTGVDVTRVLADFRRLFPG